MSRLAHWCFQHCRRVAGCLLALVAMIAVSTAVGSRFDTDTGLPGTDPHNAHNLLNANFPAAAGKGDQMVIHTTNGTTVRSPQVRAGVTQAVTRMAAVPGVTSVGSPYAAGGSSHVSADSTVAFATIIWNTTTPDTTAVIQLIAAADSADSASTHISLGGRAIRNPEGGGAGLSVLVGVAAALAALLLIFGEDLAPGGAQWDGFQGSAEAQLARRPDRARRRSSLRRGRNHTSKARQRPRSLPRSATVGRSTER